MPPAASAAGANATKTPAPTMAAQADDDGVAGAEPAREAGGLVGHMVSMPAAATTREPVAERPLLFALSQVRAV